MPDIDTSPAALRALAEQMDDVSLIPAKIGDVACDTLRALAAEKEAATVKPDLTVGATDRPERLWLSAPDADGDHGVWFDGGEGGTEYVRADIADDLRASLAAAEKERDAQTTPLLWWKDHALKVETERDAAIARAEKAEADRDRLQEALTGLLSLYVELVNCGDCGRWDPEAVPQVIAARAALAKAEDRS